MRNMIVVALLLVGCGPEPLENAPAVRSEQSKPVDEPLRPSTDDRLSAAITMPRVDGYSAAASEAIRRELLAIERQAILGANRCLLITDEGQANFAFKAQSVATRKHFASVRFVAEGRCNQREERWTMVRTFNLATGEQVEPLALINMTMEHWQALVASQATPAFRACTDRGHSDVIHLPIPYIAEGGIGVQLSLSPDAPQSCLSELVVPIEVVRRASEDRLAKAGRGPPHPDYLFE